MIKVISTMALNGIDGIPVVVESSCVGSPSPRLDIIGLPDAAVKEAAGRVRAAARSSGLPLHNGVLTVNLAPADVRKEGSSFDLPILLSLINTDASERIDYGGKCFAGELSLTGEVKHITGALPMAISARDLGYKQIFLPEADAAEASAAQGIEVFPVRDVLSLYNHLTGGKQLAPVPFSEERLRAEAAARALDFADIKGQDAAKTALEIAAAGGHNVLMIGPPGSGKSMLAKRLPSILPDMTFEESLETTKLYSVAGALPEGVSLMTQRPFRSPHHTVSPAGLSGGGTIPRPGEISLAHNGVLFLDELPEFSRQAMEVLRQPMEDSKITISRVSASLSYPCSAMIVCAMNPCPCGYYGHPTRRCTCTQQSVQRYLSRLSGPLLDRLDIHIEVPPVEFASLSGTSQGECSADIRKRVNAARAIQTERLKGSGISCNAKMDAAQTKKFCRPTPEGMILLERVFEKLELSARAYDKILRIARTVADLDGSETVNSDHISQAVQYRSLDRTLWRNVK